MPVLTVWGFPAGVSENNIKKFETAIKKTVAAIKEMEVGPERVFVHLPAEHTGKTMIVVPESGFPAVKEINVIVEILFEAPKRGMYIRQLLAEEICRVIASYFPKAAIRCFIKPFDPNQGYGRKVP